jgi:hypothetical protein
MKRVSQALGTGMLLDQLFHAEEGLIAVCGDFNATEDEVPLEAIRGDIQDNNNPALVGQVMIPRGRNIPEPGRFSLIRHGVGQMMDHVLVWRRLFASYHLAGVHSEYVYNESSPFASDDKFPDSDQTLFAESGSHEVT